MAKIELTFPVFYHCAIKKASPITQYNCVNLLLTGSIKGDDVRSIPEATASIYVNGVKPLPKDLIYDLLHCGEEDIIERFRELNFFDVSAIAGALARLLDAVSITPAAKESLLAFHIPGMEYQFLCQVFWAAVKNSAFKTSRLRKEEKSIIQACRDSSPLPGDVSPAPREVEEPLSNLEKLASVRNIGAIPPLSERKNSIAESYLKFMAELDEYDDSQPTPLTMGDYDDQLLIRTWRPAKQTKEEEIAEFFYSIIGDEAPAILKIDHADIMRVVRGGDPGAIRMIECMGEEAGVLHYLTDQPQLRGVGNAVVVEDISYEGSFELMTQLATAVQDSMAPDANVVVGVRMMEDIPEGHICVRVLISH